MNQEFVRHPTIKIYEASRDGIVRNCRLKKPVGAGNNSGYQRFCTGGKMYYNHRFMYTVYNGEIPKRFLVDHIDGNIKNNSVNNLRVLSQSKNCSSGKTGRCKTVTRKVFRSINATTAKEKIFQSISAAGKYFGICLPSVQKVADGIRKSALSKKFNQKDLILLYFLRS